MGSGEVFRLGATTPPNAFAHAGAYVQASAQADWSTRRGIDITAGFDLQGQVNAAAGGSGLAASFGAGVDVSGAFAMQAALPIDLFSAEGAGLIARLQAKLALTAFVTAALTLDISVLQQTVQGNFSGSMSALLDIVLDELDVSAGFWGRVSLAIEALGEAVLAGTLLPSADGGAGLSFSARYETAFIYGAGTHFITNLGFDNPQRLFTRLTGAISDELLALVTPLDPDDEALVAVGLGALHTLLPVAVRGLFQLGMALADSATSSSALPPVTGDPAAPADVPADATAAVSALVGSLIAQAQQVVLQAVSDLATMLLSGALADARLAAALSRLTAADLTTITQQLTTVQTDAQALTGTDISDIDQWLTGLLTVLGDLDTAATTLAGFGVPAAVTGDIQSWTALLWAAGTLLQRIISWADDSGTGSPFSTDPVTPTPAASIAATVKPAGGTVAYADVITYLIGSQVTSTDLETALRNAIPQAGAAFDWLNTVLGSSQGQLLQTLFQTLAAPSAQQAATLISQLGAVAADALTSHIIPELLDPLAAAESDPMVAAFIEDVVKPALIALPQSILPALAGLGTATSGPSAASALDASDAALRLREAVSAVLLQIVEHFLATTLKALIDHALTNAQAALNTAAQDVSAGGPVTKAVQDIDALAAVLLTEAPESALLIPTPGDIVNLLTLAGVVANDLEPLSDDLFGLVDTLMQFALGSDATRQASLTALTSSDQPVDQPDLSQALSKVGDGALKVVGDVLDDLPTLAADHVANEVAAVVAAVEQVAGQIVTALNDAVSALQHAGQTAANYISTVLLPGLQTLLGNLASTISHFSSQIQSLAQQAVDAIQQAGQNLIEGLIGSLPGWIQDAIISLYDDLFAVIDDIVGFVTGILAAGGEAVADVLYAIAGGRHGTQADADAALQQGLLAASSADLNFDLKVSVAGITVADLGTVTIGRGTIGGVLHDQISGDGQSQQWLTDGVGQAASVAQMNAQVAAAQTQQAANTAQTAALQATVDSFTLSATPTVAIVTPTPGTAVPFGARVLICVSGANAGFVATTLGAAPRVVVTVNGVRWSYQPADWVTNSLFPETLILQADLVAFPAAANLPTATGGTAALTPQSVTTAPTVSATFDAATGTLALQSTAPAPPDRQAEPPQPLSLTERPWTSRALLRLALADPAGTVTAGLAGVGRFAAANAGTGQRTPVPVPQPWTLNPPPPDPAISRSVPVMVGKLGLNTISVAVADGAGHTATATTTVVIEPGTLYAISNKLSGSCLTVAGGETEAAAGASVQQFAWTGGRNQMWQLQAGGPNSAPGAYDLIAAHSGLSLGLSTAIPSGDYDGWYGCAKCGALFAANGPPSPTVCAGGGPHDPGTGPDYFLANQVVVLGWTECVKCAVLFQDVAGQPSVCPAGGAHAGEIAAETHWVLDTSVTPGPDMPSWNWCGKCGALVAFFTAPFHICAAGGVHSTTGSATIVAPSLDMDGTPLAQGNPGGPWQVIPAADPLYRLFQRQSGGVVTHVADVAAMSTADGATVEQAAFSGADSQLWRLTPVPAIDPAAYYTITNRSSGLVMEVQGGPTATADGAAIDQTAATGQANQRWRFLPNSDGSYAIVAEHSGSCVTIPWLIASKDTGPVLQSGPLALPGSGAPSPQSWQLLPADTGYYQIQSVSTSLALDGGAGSTAGALVGQSTWTGAASQEWSLSMVTGPDQTAWYTITAQHSGLALGVAGGPAATQPGTAVEQEVPANMTSQRWQLQPGYFVGSYMFLAQHTTFASGADGYFGLPSGVIAGGTPVVMTANVPGGTQNWQLIPVELGLWKIQNVNAGLVLQAGSDPSALAPGAAAQIAAWTGADNQKWRLTR